MQLEIMDYRFQVPNEFHAHDLSDWQHQHVFHRVNPHAERNTWRVVILTAAMMIAELIGGAVFNSMALLADGWHMGTHVAALGISGMAYGLARKYAQDGRYAFGTWKIEVLGAYTSAILLGVVAIGMAIESILRLTRPLPIQYDYALWVAVVGLAVNAVSALLLGGHQHGHAEHDHEHGHHAHEDLNLRSAYVHVITDAITSVLAIVALLAGKFANLPQLDPIMGMVGAIIVGWWSIGLIRDSSRVLLDREMDNPLVQSIRESLESDGDAKVADLHVWRVGRERFACVATVVADRPLSPDQYRERLSGRSELVHVSIEVNVCPNTDSPTR